ncbi:MAG: hypothetical protein K6U74_03225 [Firmicutes bacterium]|nr:hypothetical protein [Bacillota bacterium]
MKIKNLIVSVLTLATAFFVCINASLAGPVEENIIKQFWEGRGIEPEAVTEAVRVVTNDELKPYNFDEIYYKESLESGERLNPLNYVWYEVLAYGAPHGDLDQDEHRYLGYTANGEAYTNTFFRPDFADGVQIDQANWIHHPFDNDLVATFLNRMKEPSLKWNNFNYQERYRDTILLGFDILNFTNPDYYRINFEAAKDRDWEHYVHILQPPSKYCWGTGRMFRQLPNGSMRYMDVPLVSFGDLTVDFAATLEKDSYQGKPGERIDTTAVFELNQEALFAAEGKLRLYLKTPSGETELPFAPIDSSKKLNGNQYTFRPGEKLEVGFSFTVPGEPAEIVARIDRTYRGRFWTEKNLANNEDRAPVIAGQYDVKVQIIPEKTVYTAFDGGETPVCNRIRISRKDDLPGEIDVSGFVSGPEGRYPINCKVGREYVEFPYDFPGAPGSYTIEAEAWPVGSDDAYPEDNRDVVTVTVVEEVTKTDSKIHVELLN